MTSSETIRTECDVTLAELLTNNELGLQRLVTEMAFKPLFETECVIENIQITPVEVLANGLIRLDVVGVRKEIDPKETFEARECNISIEEIADGTFESFLDIIVERAFDDPRVTDVSYDPLGINYDGSVRILVSGYTTMIRNDEW